jgi:plasmid stabilization system protein ParE
VRYHIEFLVKARLELLQAWNWYEDRQPGLGSRFKDAVYEGLYSISLNPEQYPEKIKHYRETVIDVFPYVIIYRVHKRKQIVAVLSIFHTSRNPKKKFK